MSVLVTTSPAAGAAQQALPAAISFATPPPGMGALRSFELSALDETGFLFSLRSTEDASVRLFLVPPVPYFPEYAPQLDGEVLDELDDPAPVVLVVVHPGQGDGAPTANLLAPVVVGRTGRARQVVLDGDQWPLRAPLSAGSSAA